MWEGKPFLGRDREQLETFLGKMDLEYDDGIEYSVCMANEEGEIIATGSVEENVLKCIAIDPSCQGQGLSGIILSQLAQYAVGQGRTHLFMYTKPKNLEMFADLGFYPIIQTSEVLFMENRPEGFKKFMAQVKAETPKEALEGRKRIGAVVANGNPFTLGHRYLLEQAVRQCDWLHLFILSDRRTFFSPQARFAMAKAGIVGLEKVILHQTSDYMVSAATFPTYFMKEKAQARKANCRLDLELFARKIAPELGIQKRFVGTEPECLVTDSYNQSMKEILPGYGIQVVEIARKELNGQPVSASRVREAVKSGCLQEIREMIPESTYSYLVEHSVK